MNMITILLVIAAMATNLAEITWLTEALLLGAAAMVAAALSPVKVGVKVEKYEEESDKKYNFQREFEENLYWILNPKIDPKEHAERTVELTDYFIKKQISKDVGLKIIRETAFNLLDRMQDGSLDHIENAWHLGYNIARLKQLIKIAVSPTNESNP